MHVSWLIHPCSFLFGCRSIKTEREGLGAASKYLAEADAQLSDRFQCRGPGYWICWFTGVQFWFNARQWVRYRNLRLIRIAVGWRFWYCHSLHLWSVSEVRCHRLQNIVCIWCVRFTNYCDGLSQVHCRIRFSVAMCLRDVGWTRIVATSHTALNSILIIHTYPGWGRDWLKTVTLETATDS